MKKDSRKLNLNRETLIPLQADDLANVNGGTLTPTTTITTSSRPCLTTVSIPTSSISLAQK